jgi:hypothetical protein
MGIERTAQMFVESLKARADLTRWVIGVPDSTVVPGKVEPVPILDRRVGKDENTMEMLQIKKKELFQALLLSPVEELSY